MRDAHCVLIQREGDPEAYLMVAKVPYAELPAVLRDLADDAEACADLEELAARVEEKS